MTSCYGCGAHISFRYIDGRCVPLGCNCGSRRGGRGRRAVIFRSLQGGCHFYPVPLTYQTSCWWCGKPVFYHTNGNGDCVLLDELGPPWPIHECWLAHREATASFLAAEASRVLREGTKLRALQVTPSDVLDARGWASPGFLDVDVWQQAPSHAEPAPINPLPPAGDFYLITGWIANAERSGSHALGLGAPSGLGPVVTLSGGHVFVSGVEQRWEVGGWVAVEVEVVEGHNGLHFYLCHRLVCSE